MTRREIITEVGNRLGDTSDEFVLKVVNPSFDFVLLDLAQRECIGPLRRRAVFAAIAEQRDYETREICRLEPPHYPHDVEKLVVYGWGLPDGRVPRAQSDREFEEMRLLQGDGMRGHWQLWRLFPNNRRLEITPPTSVVDDGVAVEITFTIAPRLLGLDEDLIDLHLEDIPTVIQGLRAVAALFAEQTQSDQATALPLYEVAARRMWGNRWNRHPAQMQTGGL